MKSMRASMTVALLAPGAAQAGRQGGPPLALGALRPLCRRLGCTNSFERAGRVW